MNRPRPVLTRSGIAGAVTAVAGLAAWLGYTGAAANISGQAETVGAVVVALLGFFPHVASAISAEKVVTPLEDPRDNNGTQLAAPATSDIVSTAPEPDGAVDITA